MNGYWFCYSCDEVVTLPMPKDDITLPLQKCPVCHKNAADFKPHTIPVLKRKAVDAETAAEKFQAMKDSIL